MAKFIADTKNKIQDLVVSSKKSSGNDQGTTRDVLGDDPRQTIYIPEEDQAGPASDVPARNAQGQGHIVVIGQGNNTQNQGQTTNIPQGDAQQGQGINQSGGNAQEQKQEEEEEQEEEENEDDFEPLPEGFVPEERANISKPPGKRSAPTPKTG
ncbi:hypothetical protein K7X08_001443 [Anisodus acutangulus]|uniref:Uncharacterized protein n=1 Tax=Anisodus acutangulus TaxID=402998 RepID=A0A9Q1RP46_9SOLA|nr:hypothetical protein K7X08_001443 [Anisodus acutangulus]